MKKFLFTLLTLFMASSAFAGDYFYIDDITLTKEEAAKGCNKIAYVKAHFDNAVSAWQVDLTLPEGVTIDVVQRQADMTITYLDKVTDEETMDVSYAENTYTPDLATTPDNTRFIVSVFTTVEYDEAGNSYGICYRPGDYDAMWRVRLVIPAGFKGGDLNVHTAPSGPAKPYPGLTTSDKVPSDHVTAIRIKADTPEIAVDGDQYKKTVTITAEEGATIYYSTDNETFDAYNAPFTIFETTTVKAYAKLGELASDTVYAKYNAAVMVYDLEEANALDNKTNFYFQGDAVVTYKNGKNLWIRDEKGSGLIFGNTIASGEFKTGDVLNKGWDAQKYNYGSDGYEKFIPEFQYPNNVKASGVTQTVEPAVYSTITTDNVNEYILMKNQTLTEMKNADGLVFYNKFDIEGLNIEDGKAYDIVGVVTIYHDEPEVYIISATEVSSQTLVGDVDEDGNVNITDVTALIDMLLSDNTKPSGDVNGDGSINITDVTDLIDILLKN